MLLLIVILIVYQYIITYLCNRRYGRREPRLHWLSTYTNNTGRHVFVLVGSNPTVVTNVAPVLVIRTDVVAEASQCRIRGEVALMRSRGDGPLYPSLRRTSAEQSSSLIPGIQQGYARASLTRWGSLCVTPESVADYLPISISRGRVNTVNDVRPLVTRGLILLDR